MLKSIDIMIKNSKLETNIPGGEEVAATMRGVQAIAKAGKGPLSADEFAFMATQYSAARDDLRRLFEAMGPEEQAEGKAIVRGIRAKDEARLRIMEAANAEEEEKLRAARARLKEQAAARPAPPPTPYKEDAQSIAIAQRALYGR